MAKDEGQAALAADELLEMLIQHQPQLFASHPPTPGNGTSLGKAIAALRLQLIEMYKTQP